MIIMDKRINANNIIATAKENAEKISVIHL